MADARCPECMGHRGLPRLIHDGDEPKECANPFHTEVVAPEPEPEPEKKTLPPEQPVAPPTLSPTGSMTVCPYCGADPMLIKASKGMIGPALILMVRCGNDNCRKMVGIVPLGLAGPPMPVAMPGGPLQ